MFNFDNDSWAITLHQGDTGSKWVRGTRKSGTDWTDDDRCLFTVRNATGDIVMQRLYRLDDQWGAGNGYFLMEFHNSDTDKLPTGTYSTEWRFGVNPLWDGTPNNGRCVNVLATNVHMTDGDIVRTCIQSTMTILGVLGEV